MTSLADLQTTLKLLSDSTRLRLLALLSQEEMAVHELVTITGLAQSRVSNHLSLLKRSGLVRDRRDGSWSFHTLVEPSAEGPLSPELFDAVIRPFASSDEGRSDTQALEAVREQRRERSRLTHDALAAEWGEPGHGFTSDALRSEVLAAAIPERMVVADLGCGAGYLTGFLAERTARVLAIDHSSNMLDAAQRHASSEHAARRDRVEFRRGELDELPIDDAEVDAAFANLVWHHLADMERAASEAYRVIRPGGALVVSDLLPHDQDWMRERLGDLRLGIRPDVVVSALARAGFGALNSSTSSDHYRAEGPDGHSIELPMFVVRGVKPREHH